MQEPDVIVMAANLDWKRTPQHLGPCQQMYLVDLTSLFRPSVHLIHHSSFLMGHEFADVQARRVLVVVRTRLNPSSKEGGQRPTSVEMPFASSSYSVIPTHHYVSEAFSIHPLRFLLANKRRSIYSYFHQVCSKPGSYEFKQPHSMR